MTWRQLSKPCSASQPQAIGLLKLNEMTLKEATVLTGMSVGVPKVVARRVLQRLRKSLPLCSGDAASTKVRQGEWQSRTGGVVVALPPLFQDLGATVMVMMRNVGTPALFVGLAAPLSRKMLLGRVG